MMCWKTVFFTKKIPNLRLLNVSVCIFYIDEHSMTHSFSVPFMGIAII